MKPNTCLVVDVWEGQLQIDEAVLKANGVAGMAIRLNDMSGGHHMDGNFLTQWAEAKNFVRFPYFVYNPWVDGAANYAWLAANVPSEVKTVAVDIEVAKAGYAASTYAGEVGKFLDLCKTRWKMIIYTAQWFLPNISNWPRIDYWWAQYPDGPTYFGGVKTWDELRLRLDRLDKPFNQNSVPGTLKMWQFSGDYLVLPGNSRNIDVNIFYGTEQDLADYIGSGSPPAPVQQPGLYQFNNLNYYMRPGGTPLTLPLSWNRQAGSNQLQFDWASFRTFLNKLNPTNLAAVDSLLRPDWGLNKGQVGTLINWIGMTWPGRNILKIAEVLEGWGRVDGIGRFSAVQSSTNTSGVVVPVMLVDLSSVDLSRLNPFDNLDVIHLVCDYNGASGWAERAKPIYVPLLGGPWWVEMSKLTPISKQLPKVVKIKAFPRLNVRAGAGMIEAIVGYKNFGEAVTVTEVKIGTGGLWGKVSNGWISLRQNNSNWTDWKI